MNKPLPRTIDDILNGDDEFGLLKNVRPAKPIPRSSSDPVVQNFLEILAFVEANGREPSSEINGEKLLATRLYAYRLNSQLAAKVRQYDTHGLLSEEVQQPVQEEPAKEIEVTSLDDIFANDSMGLLDDIDTSIFKLEHVKAPAGTDKVAPDEIAQRKPCPDFYNYQKFFEDLQSALKTNAVMLKSTIRESDVIPGHAFIVRGMICYVDRILKAGATTTDGRDNPRFRVIFDNGTETNLLRYSLVKALSGDPHGKYIDTELNLLSDGTIKITQKDRPTGFVYVLGTDSKAPELASLRAAKKLVKIGYSTQPVEKRTANAEKEATYLFAPVRVLGIIDCYNLNPHAFEQVIHAFLADQRLNITLKSSSGHSYRPEEWFTVDARTAMEICKRIIDGSIVQYRMDNVSGKIVKKSTVPVDDVQVVDQPEAAIPTVSFKALSVRQPWASMLVQGQKTVEMRRWKTDWRGPLLICAGRQYDQVYGDILLPAGLRLPLGAAIGVVDLYDITPMTPDLFGAACLDPHPSPQDRAAWLEQHAWHVRPLYAIRPMLVNGRLHVFDCELPVVRLPEGMSHYDYLKNLK